MAENKPWLMQSKPILGAEEVTPPEEATPQPIAEAPVKPWLQQAQPTVEAPAPIAEKPAVEKPAAETPKKEGFLSRVKKAYTGEGRIDPDYADQPEFGDAFRAQTGTGWNSPELGKIRDAIGLAQVAPTDTGRINILKSRIPGLEVKQDKFGNYVARAPGMEKFAYINKPGFSAQDVGEFGMQTIATLPFLGPAGAGTSTLARIGAGAGGMAAASVAQDALASGVGSQEGIDPVRAGISAGVGAALPVAGAALRAGKAVAAYPVNRVKAAINPDSVATQSVQKALVADRAAPRGVPLSAQEVATARTRGQDLRTMDLGGGEATRALARSAANQSPEARSMLMNLIDERFETQGPRFTEFLRSLTARPGNSAVNANLTRDQLQSAARAARSPLYKKAYADGAQGLMSPVLTNLERAPAVKAAMNAAATSLRNRAAVGKTTGARGPNGYTLEYWDLVKRRLDDRIQAFKRSGAKSAALELDELRRPLVQELDRLVSSYAPARGTAQTFFRAGDALEAGENFVTGRFDIDSARKALAAMTPQERQLFAEGFASRFIERVGKMGDRRSILNAINASPDARMRVQIALGPNRARALESFMRVEGIMDSARQAMGNSTTARQLAEMGLVGYGYYSEDPHALLIAALSYGNRQLDRRVAERVAKMLLSDNPEQFLQGLKQVGSTPMLDSLRTVDKALTRIGAGREVAQELSPTNPQSNANAPAPPLPAPTAPAPRAPAPNAPQDVPSVSVPKGRSAALQGREEALRMAEEAISHGADRNAVMERLNRYLAVNGIN